MTWMGVLMALAIIAGLVIALACALNMLIDLFDLFAGDREEE